jgi:hypothetical protein
MITSFGRARFAIGFVCLVLVADEARSVPITFAFKGTVDRVLVFVPIAQQNWPEPGTTFQGTYTFDSDAVDSSDDEFSGVYTTPPPSEVRLAAGQLELTGIGSYVATYNILTPGPRDVYEAGNWLDSLEITSDPDLAAVLNRNHFQLRIDGNTLLLDGLVLPLTPPLLGHAFAAPLIFSTPDTHRCDRSDARR